MAVGTPRPHAALAPARLLTAVTAHHAPAVLTPQPDDAPWTERTDRQLLDEHRALGRRPLDLHHALRRSLLEEALLLRLAHSPDIPPPPGSPGRRAAVHRQFLDALELHFRELHHVDDYRPPARSARSPGPRGTPPAPERGR
ncbi:hypothetical protein [Amycolatopsis sp. YIM 10]|uniref:hypothetical protein n=1 Tax=Amycolatopsis sp. YIM 10 TaxID=2653857 RepID=UPI0012A7F9A3|nr:hypothetical protein [Amycolatopsis sp. YIM 10]QFU90530.1 hypothetical protein YIM_26780 [Amycolatopsis sp. YIM 10]